MSKDFDATNQTLDTATALTQEALAEPRTVRTTPAAGDQPPRKVSSVRRAQAYSEPISPQGLLLALKRRWRQATLIGVPALLCGTVLAWLVVPAHFTAFTLLSISSMQQRLVFKTADEDADFFTYQKTQKAMIRSRFVLNAALRRPGIAELETVRDETYPVQWLEGALVVDSHNSPEILKIALHGNRPKELAAIVNAVKDAYLEEVVLSDRKKRIARLNDLERIFEQTEEKVRQKEQRVENLAKQLGTGDAKALSFKQQMALEHFSLLKREHARIRFELMQEQIRDTAGGSLDSVALTQRSAFDGPGPGQQLTEQEARRMLIVSRIGQLKELIARYEKQVVDQNHPTLLEYREEVASLKKSLGQDPDKEESGSGTRLDLLKRQEELMSEELDKYAEMVKNIGTSSFELELMKTEIDQIATVSDRVGSEMEALRIELQSPTRVALIQEADVPQTRDMSRKRNLAGVAGVGSLFVSLLIIGVIEFHARRMTEPQDVSETLGLNLLGTLPAMPKSLLFWKQPKQARMAVWNNALIESIDSVRSILLHSSDEEQRKVIMVASASPGEGKTTLACQLAGSLARAGRKTLLVDCDIRRPRVHELLNVPLEMGLSELLTEGLLVSQVTHRTSEPNLHVIPAGQMNETALQAIARDGAADLFAELREEYEFVIVDTSPVLYVADGGAIGRNVDGAVLTVRSHTSRLPQVAVACERLEMLGIDIVGAVMVGVRQTLSGYGYSYDYHYGSTEARS
ncbi:MAG: polysaccharide biosynthesis tyrosine autokinase [Planctomycetota bacterium]|nr:polysaccharide biosynthesis tyrosine autokinase [Planctomycetota bacterium]